MRSGKQVIGLIMLLTAGSAATAATFTWSGSSVGVTGNNNWSNLFNWVSGIPANDATADVVIPLSSRNAPIVDLPWSIDDLRFEGPTSITLGGQALTIDSDITHIGTATVTLNNALVAPATADSATWRAAGGTLVINGPISGAKTNFFLEGVHPIIFDGSAVNTMSEQMHLREGTLVLSRSSANGAVAGNLAIGNPSGAAATTVWDASEQISQAAGVTVFVRATGVANLNAKIETLDRLFVEGLVQSAGGKLAVVSHLNVGAGTINMGIGELVLPPLVVNSGANAQATINASLVRLADTETEFRLGDRTVPIEMIVNGVVADSQAGPSLLRKTFEGALELTGPNTYTGGTVVEEGVLRVTNTSGSATGAGQVTILTGGRVDGTGTIAGSVLVSAGAALAPGVAIGRIKTGPLTLAAGSQSQIQLAGTLKGVDYDFVDVNGAANIGGTLLLLPIGGYDPALGTVHNIIHGTSRTGTFSQITGVTLGPGKALAVTYDSDDVLVTAAIPGDANLDGQVDITDLAALATNWQTVDTWVGGDFNGTGLVDISDLAALATNWQVGVPGAPLAMTFDEALASVGLGNVSVPEPAVMVVLLGLPAYAAGRCSRPKRCASDIAA